MENEYEMRVIQMTSTKPSKKHDVSTDQMGTLAVLEKHRWTKILYLKLVKACFLGFTWFVVYKSDANRVSVQK